MRRTISLYAHQAINLSTGGQYSLNHFCTSAVCFLWSFHFLVASKPLKTILTWHPSLQWIVSQNNKGSNKLEVNLSRWRCPWCLVKANHIKVFIISGKRRWLLYFWLKRWSEKVHRSILQAPLNNNSFLFVFLPHSRKQRCGVRQTAIQWNLPITKGQKHVVEQPGLDLQYLGKPCSICLPISPSAAAIWQESLKVHSWQRDKAGKECPSDNTEKSENIFLCLYLSHRHLKNRGLLTVGEKLKLSLPCQELADSNGETTKVTLEDSPSHSFSLPLWFQGPREELTLE